MSVRPGYYGGFGIRSKEGSARKRLDPIPELWLRAMAREQAALSKPYKGITTHGHIVPDLFPLLQTGVSTRPVKEAGDAFIATLDRAQRAALVHPIDSPNWRRWCNWEQYTFRHGMALEDMNAAQREAALMLLRTSLSVRGFETARNVMKLNHVLGEITQNWDLLGEWLYFLCILGSPSFGEPWGWQLDGHHLNLNYFVLGDQVVLSPGFWGAEPAVADRGKYQGLREFEAEQRNGLELIRALNPLQRNRAIIYPSMLSRDLPPDRYSVNNGRQQSAAFSDNAVIAQEGIRADSLSNAQQELLLELIRTYTNHLPPGHDAIWMEQVRNHLLDTSFAWIGGFGDNDTFYYKVYSPVLLIEFDMHKGVFLANDEPQKFHIHITLRTPNGNDYGRDLLRQHLARHHHMPR